MVHKKVMHIPQTVLWPRLNPTFGSRFETYYFLRICYGLTKKAIYGPGIFRRFVFVKIITYILNENPFSLWVVKKINDPRFYDLQETSHAWDGYTELCVTQSTEDKDLSPLCSVVVQRCVLDHGTSGDVQRMSVRTDDVIKLRRHVGRTWDRQVEQKLSIVSSVVDVNFCGFLQAVSRNRWGNLTMLVSSAKTVYKENVPRIGSLGFNVSLVLKFAFLPSPLPPNVRLTCELEWINVLSQVENYTYPYV